MIEIREYNANDEKLQAILRRGSDIDSDVRAAVEKIIAGVRARGDAALCEFSEKFDGVKLTPEKIRVAPEEFEEAQGKVAEDFLTAVALARVNIRRFHEYQRRAAYVHDDGDGVRLSKRVLPLKKVGVCCPAKSAPLFSSMLMNVIPAQVAGVDEIYAVVPPRADGTVDPHILVTAKLLGIDAVFRVGGAHAVAALAYGTKAIPAVDKIAGPGNAYVTMAKRLVFGACGIDSLAGPSELVIIADGLAKAKYVAADLMSQLEHGSGWEVGVVFTTSRDLAAGIKIEVERQLQKLERKDKIIHALEKYGAIYLCEDLSDGMDASNLIAPEHLEIIAVDEDELLADVENAGAVFLGPFSAEPVGDYFAGTNHVLPTGGAARFSSSLSVYDFVKDISVIEYSAERLQRAGRHIVRMAEIEGLTAHANAIRVRLEDL
jgi:histidinol dehydrogenase